jgi:Tfp pilus assembly protein PilF
MERLTAAIAEASYNAFYNLVACALETGNKERAGDYLLAAYEHLPELEAERMERELTKDYYEFT